MELSGVSFFTKQTIHHIPDIVQQIVQTFSWITSMLKHKTTACGGGGGGVLYWCPIFFWDSYKLHGCTAQLGLWTVYSVVLHCYILCIVSMNRIYISLTTWTKCDIKHLRLNIEMVKCNCDRIEIYNVISFWICSQNSVSKEEKFPILKSFSHLDKKLLITLKNMICSSTMLCESPEYYVSLILKGLKLKVLFDCQMPLLMCKLHI